MWILYLNSTNLILIFKNKLTKEKLDMMYNTFLSLSRIATLLIVHIKFLQLNHKGIFIVLFIISLNLILKFIL
jgi:hypothetical protein